MTALSPGRPPPAAWPVVLGSMEVVAGVLTVAAARRLATSPWAGLSVDGMRRVVQLLGARQVAQGAVTIGWPRRQVLTGGAAIDALHALSLVPVIVVRGPYRRPSTGSAVLAVAGLAAALAARRRT